MIGSVSVPCGLDALPGAAVKPFAKDLLEHASIFRLFDTRQ